MSDTPLNLEAIRAMAEAIGLRHLSDIQLEQLLQVTNTKRTQSADALLANLNPTDEPVNVFAPKTSKIGLPS